MLHLPRLQRPLQSSFDVLLVELLLKRPSLQTLHCESEVKAICVPYLPRLQPLQAAADIRPGCAPNVPGSQAVGALVPLPQKCALRQMTHAVAPSASWYVPGLHLVHVSCRSSALYVPGAHSVALALPTGQ